LLCEQTMAALLAGVSTRTFIDAILDEGLACHMTFVSEGIPSCCRWPTPAVGTSSTFTGARGSRLLQALGDGPQVCVTVTLLDGLVLAASAFSHSMNYRSAVVIVRAAAVSDPAEKLAALRRCRSTPSPAAERTSDLPSKRELAATTVLSLPLDQASARCAAGSRRRPGRSGQPRVGGGDSADAVGLGTGLRRRRGGEAARTRLCGEPHRASGGVAPGPAGGRRPGRAAGRRRVGACRGLSPLPSSASPSRSPAVSIRSRSGPFSSRWERLRNRPPQARW
jgi:nitroimidazol reductase NimA-like FMN-containing flavoprotein (pyridoxamine 5'-phosphate oxidase superfamily)